jgi:aminoglycoside phosphotransferase
MRPSLLLLSCATMMATLLAAVSAFAQTSDYDAQVRAVMKGQPKPVVAFIKRKVACDHWAGEEPYDKKRAAEIAKAERRLRCASVDQTDIALRHRYRPNAHVLKALDALRRLEAQG